MKESKSAILVRSNADLVVDTVTLPSKLQFGQVLVKLISSGVCGAQLSEIKAKKGPDKFLPHLLGHEGYCEILQIGPNVKWMKPGDFAIMHWRPGNGIQSDNPKYMWQGTPLNAGWVTTFNEYAVVSENRLTPIKETKIPKNILPMLGCAITTAYGALERETKFSARDSLLIFGAGGVGLSLVCSAKSLGGLKIIVVDRDKAKLEIAKKLGATDIINSVDNHEIKNELRDICKNPPTISVDTTGSIQAMECAYESISPEGHLLTLGIPEYGKKMSINPLELQFGKKITGSHGGLSIPSRDIPFILSLMEKSVLNFQNFPYKEYALENINQAIWDLENGVPGRMIINFDKV